MGNFNPSLPYNVPIYLVNPTITTVKGVHKKTYPDYADGELLYCSFKTYGGTEADKNGILSVIDTANVETWYRPDIKAGSRIYLADRPDKCYDVLGEPENINMRNQFVKFKVQAVSGGA